MGFEPTMGVSPSFLMFFVPQGTIPIPAPWRPTALQSSRGSGTIRRPGTRPDRRSPPPWESQHREIQIPNLVGGINVSGWIRWYYWGLKIPYLGVVDLPL